MRILTWNMQGASAQGEYVKWNEILGRASGCHAICLQECGEVPRSAGQEPVAEISGYPVYKLRFGTESRGVDCYVTHGAWDLGGHRCNLAVISPSQPSNITVKWPTRRQWRYALGVRLDRAWIYTVHAISPRGPDASLLVESVGRTRGPWIAAGDYNCEPPMLRPRLDHLCVVHPPNQATYHSDRPTRSLDYAVSSLDVSPNSVIGEVQARLSSDHRPVAFNFPN